MDDISEEGDDVPPKEGGYPSVSPYPMGENKDKMRENVFNEENAEKMDVR